MQQQHTLRDGNKIPAIGLGTATMNNTDAETYVSEALTRGYRLIDTAKNYNNEEGVGKAINRNSINREDVFITSKIPGRDQGYDTTITSLKNTLHTMGLDYLDLYLIHWPNPTQNLYVETWRAMIKLQEEGLIKSIGVSNFLPSHIDRLIEETGITPAVNQIELNPYHQQEQHVDYHFNKAILTQAWAPLGNKTDLITNPTITNIAQETGKTNAQIILRWHIQQNLLPIPKTTTTQRLEENLDVFTWELTDQHMRDIALLETGVSGFGLDPATHEEM